VLFNVQEESKKNLSKGFYKDDFFSVERKKTQSRKRTVRPRGLGIENIGGRNQMTPSWFVCR
jgi:hypothetical protein